MRPYRHTHPKGRLPRLGQQGPGPLAWTPDCRGGAISGACRMTIALPWRREEAKIDAMREGGKTGFRGVHGPSFGVPSVPIEGPAP